MHSKSITEEMANLTVVQMEARSKALSEASTLLRSRAPASIDDTLQGQAVADWLDAEATKWLARATRSRDVLSVAQRRTFNHFQNYIREHGKSPTISELAKFDGVTVASITPRIDMLVRKGFLVKTPNVRAGLSLCPLAPDTQP